MELLIIAATAMEVKPFTDHLHGPAGQQWQQAGISVDVLVTGVGMVATTYALTRQLCTRPYHLVLQCGVGGSFDRSLPLGSLLSITHEQLADLGAEDHDKYLPMTTLGLVDDQAHPYTHGWLASPPHRWAHLLPPTQAHGITANTVSGSQPTIDRRATLGAQIESMEGAALHYACNMQGVPYSQVRAISNYVTPRDRSQWQMGLAIKNLNEWMLGFMEGLIT